MLATHGWLNIHLPHCPPHTMRFNCHLSWEVRLWDARETERAYSTTRAPVPKLCAGMQDDSSETWPHSPHRGYKQRELRKTCVDLLCLSTCKAVFISAPWRHVTDKCGALKSCGKFQVIELNHVKSFLSSDRSACVLKKRGIGSKKGILAWQSESSQEGSLGQPWSLGDFDSISRNSVPYKVIVIAPNQFWNFESTQRTLKRVARSMWSTNAGF